MSSSVEHKLTPWREKTIKVNQRTRQHRSFFKFVITLILYLNNVTFFFFFALKFSFPCKLIYGTVKQNYIFIPLTMNFKQVSSKILLYHVKWLLVTLVDLISQVCLTQLCTLGPRFMFKSNLCDLQGYLKIQYNSFPQ